MLFRFRGRPLTDGVIDLLELNLYPPEAALGFGENHDFAITLHGRRREIGRISLRLGESVPVFYFGHIGYHINPTWRGHHFAARACALVRPMAEAAGKRSLVITADPGNLPSRKTCERLGCILESTVDVPPELQRRWELSPAKCRYVWRLSPDLT